ncbi:hypothetical protein BT69DRAFT_1266142 [Atractiella rhizophila]|nr:hypothetical protein BT69DRAFT_1266142 [Atractiella rhizophila]
MSDTSTPAPNFSAVFHPPLRRPRNPLEAQRAYNHIRTVAYFLDATEHFFPSFQLPSYIPIGVGAEAILGAIVPVLGDGLGIIMGLYQVILSVWLFKIRWQVLGLMLLYLLVDAIIGMIPVYGDLLDFIFKANLLNLALLENELKKSRWAPVLVFPKAPDLKKGSTWKAKVKKGLKK